MFTCIHDPGLALFLSERADSRAPQPGPFEWTALAVTLGLALLVLVAPA